MFFYNVSQAIDTIQNSKFVNDKIVFDPMNEQASYFLHDRRYFDAILSENQLCRREGTGIRGLTLKKNDETCIGEAVSPELIAKLRKLISCFLNYLSMNWRLTQVNNHHILTRNCEDIAPFKLQPILNMIGENYQLWTSLKNTNPVGIIFTQDTLRYFVEMHGKKEDLERFLKCLKKEAIVSCYSIHLFLCAKNDNEWNIKIPKEIIMHIAKIFIEKFVSQNNCSLK